LTIKEGRFLVAISLRTEDRSVARSRAMLIDEEAARLVQTACSHATFGDALRSFVLTLESDHRLRLLNDLESRSVRTSDNVETVLADRARQNVLYAALYWIAHRCGPGVPAQWDVLEPYLAGWALHEPEDLPLRDKIVEKVAKGFIAECFVAGSGISGTPTAEAISEALAQAGQDDTNHNRRVLFGELALTQTVSLLNAAKRYRLSPAELDTWRYSHRRQPTPSQRETGSLWPAPAFVDADAVSRGDFDCVLDPSEKEPIILTARVAADYLPYPRTTSLITIAESPEAPLREKAADVGAARTLVKNHHEIDLEQLPLEKTQAAVPARPVESADGGLSETARMFLEEHPTIDDLVALAISRRGKKWSDHTRKQVKGIGRLLAKVAGSNEVASIKPFHISRYRDVLDQLSKKYGKSPADAYRSLDELIAIGAKADKDERGLSAGTINRHLTQLGALVAVLASFDIDLAPSKGMNTLRIEDEDAEDLKRDQFTDDQVRAIFSGAPWNGVAVAPEDEGFYWLTILAAYTGARPNELVWLQRQDVDIDQKVIFIRPNSSRRLKTKESKRDIIVHKHLLALGFIDFVNRQSNPLDHIFTGYISHRRKNARERFTNQFNNLLETSIPGRSGGKLTLYSFRHKFINQLLRNGVDIAIKDMITGHARTGTRDRVYSKSIEYEQQRQILDAIDFSAGSQIQSFVAVPQKTRRIRHNIRKIF
jgi:integrase